MAEKFLLKDHLFNQAKVNQIAGEIQGVYSQFESQNFVKTVVERFPQLELKQRISWMTETLKNFLPANYREAVNILLRSLPPPNDPTKTDNDFGDFIYAPYADFVAQYGCNKKDVDFSLKVLKEITMRFSAEDAIRYFINAFPEETMNELLKWSTDENYHVRRLTSEGMRPRLPWAQKIILSPEKALPILDNLFSDKTRYVTRSVANHMNDLSKVNPELVLETLARWQKSNKQDSQEMDYIIKHSLRSLVKMGNKQAMEFLSFSADPEVVVSKISLKQNQVIIGSTVEFSFTVTAKKDERLLIDYVLYFQGKNGTMTNKKVFKLGRFEVRAGQKLVVNKRHRLGENMTTRKIYPGKHQIELQINGAKMGMKDFEVVG